jgi:alpha/beta superfamily hydrolase
VQTDHIEFTGHAGDLLAARLDRPEGPVRGCALIAHCFTCSKDFHVVREIGRALTAEGIALLRFDFTGLGQSDGDFAHTSFTTNLADLMAACRWLEANHQAPAMLIGHSLGGAAVLAVAHRLPSVRCVATIGAPYDVAHVKTLIPEGVFEEDRTAEISIGGRPFRISQAFVRDLERHPLRERIARLGRALMVCHSPVDEIVPLSAASHIFKAAKDPRSFISLDGADHLVSKPADGRFLGHVLAAWGLYYMDGR